MMLCGREQTAQHFLYDGMNEIGSLDERFQPIELRILGNAPHAEIGAAVAIELQGKTYAPLHDLQGNIASLLSLDEEPPTFYRFSAFGEESTNFSLHCPWRFSSKRTDKRTGLVNFGRRFYSSEFGRWMTPDPAGFTDGMNLYAFVHNDPLTHFDEYGLVTFDFRNGWVNCPWGSPYSYTSQQYSDRISNPAPIHWGQNAPKDLRLLPSLNLQPKYSPHYYVNGIRNTYSENLQGARSLLKTFGGMANIVPFYSESFGTYKD